RVRPPPGKGEPASRKRVLHVAVATPLVKRRQRVLKPRGSLDIGNTLDGPEGGHPQGRRSWISSATRPSDVAFIMQLTQFEFGKCERKWQPILAAPDQSCR